jgi:hypothetical protein
MVQYRDLEMFVKHPICLFIYTKRQEMGNERNVFHALLQRMLETFFTTINCYTQDAHRNTCRS